MEGCAEIFVYRSYYLLVLVPISMFFYLLVSAENWIARDGQPCFVFLWHLGVTDYLQTNSYDNQHSHFPGTREPHYSNFCSSYLLPTTGMHPYSFTNYHLPQKMENRKAVRR